MTITARNYAAQSLRAMSAAASRLEGERKQEGKIAKMIATMIPSAVHFAVPDGGKILDDGLRGLVGLEIRLPYKTITLEFFSDGARYCIVASEVDGHGIIVLCSADMGNGWVFLPVALFPRDVSADGTFGCQMVNPDGSDASSFSGAAAASFCCVAVLELCEALSCSNVDSEVIEPVDQRKNAKRIKQGKLPIYETRRLVIKAPLTRSATGHAHGGSDRQTPREHLRRGHIRRLQDGRQIWVQSCVVGNRSNGVIHKSYAVTN